MSHAPHKLLLSCHGLQASVVPWSCSPSDGINDTSLAGKTRFQHLAHKPCPETSQGGKLFGLEGKKGNTFRICPVRKAPVLSSQHPAGTKLHANTWQDKNYKKG